jgi:hypothetical protein
MGIKYRMPDCPRWRGVMHVIIHWAKEHAYWHTNYVRKQTN